MVRNGMLILGIGLFILWLAGLASGTVGWLLWLDFLGGVLSIVGALALPRTAARTGLVSEPVVLALGLLVLWLIGLSQDVAAWQAWWTLAFAFAYLLLGVSARARRPRIAS